MNQNTTILNNIKVKIFLAICLILLTLVAAPTAGAQELTIMDNGANSSNEITANQDNQSSAQQSNNANITNTVNSSSDTGGNTANVNTTGSNSINTGDAAQITDINNSLNTSLINQTCCTDQNSTVYKITGNGSGSENNASASTNSQTAVSITQNATIINNITETANTGNNTANNNNGNVSIHTGDIISNLNVNNDFVNFTKVSVPNNPKKELDIKIANNGANSDTFVNINKGNEISINSRNFAFIKNDIKSIFETGNNKANVNIGNIDIKTGDIIAQTTIQNDVNKNIAKIICCEEKEKEKPVPLEQKPTPIAPPAQPTQPSNPTVSQPSGPSNPPTQIGQVAGVAVSTLPITGSSWLFFSLLGNIVMLFLGAYLRLRSGNSPGFEFTS